MLAEGFLIVEKTDNPVIINYRKGECMNCEKRALEECSVCGCEIETKVRSLTNRTMKNGLPIGPIQKSHCPLGRWGDLETANYYRSLRGEELLTT